MARSSADASAAAVAAVLAPFPWRTFTVRTLARRAVAAVDRYVVLDFLHDVPGTEIGDLDDLQLAEADDRRVDVLVHRLDGRQWHRWSLARLCASVTSSLDAWHREQEWSDPDLR